MTYPFLASRKECAPSRRGGDSPNGAATGLTAVGAAAGGSRLPSPAAANGGGGGGGRAEEVQHLDAIDKIEEAVDV